jgi:hypothetical protein
MSIKCKIFFEFLKIKDHVGPLGRNRPGSPIEDRLLNGDRLGELNGEAIGIGPNHRAAGLKVLFPGESQNDLVASRRRRFASDEDPLGTDVVDEFTINFLVDHIIDRDHTFPSVVRTPTGCEDVTCIFHDVVPHLLIHQVASSPFVPWQAAACIGVWGPCATFDCAWTARQKRRLKKRLAILLSNLLANFYPFDRYFS